MAKRSKKSASNSESKVHNYIAYHHHQIDANAQWKLQSYLSLVYVLCSEWFAAENQKTAFTQPSAEVGVSGHHDQDKISSLAKLLKKGNSMTIH